MNTKRWLFIALLIVGLLGIAATIWFLFIKPSQDLRVAVTPPVATSTLPQTAQKPAPVVTPTTPKPTPQPAADSPQELERKAREALFRQSRDLTSRLGTFSNADGFSAVTQVYADVTPDVQTLLEQQRAQLLGAHPERGSVFTQTTRALAARLTQDVAVYTATNVEVIVDVQQQTQDGATATTDVRQAILKLTKSGSTWKITHVIWQEFSPA
ncbi:hypothetical protein KBB27_00165 [Patescibacteria group bacterium]|nr:hypothetical protein [Patescibacteria group bacterium]